MNRGIAIASVAGVMISLAACGTAGPPPPPPCSGLTISADDKLAAQKGYEVEKTDRRGYECELRIDGEGWYIDD